MAGSGFGSGGGGDAPTSLWNTGPGTSAPAYSQPSAGKPDVPSLPGSFSVDVTSPQGAAAAMADNAKEGQNFLVGLGSALFGPNEGLATGGVTGFLQQDQSPVGALARFAGGVPGGVGDTIKNAVGAVGGGLEHVHLPSAEGDAKLQGQFDSIPADFAGKAEALAAIAKDPGATGHYMSKAYTDYVKEVRATGDVKLSAFDTPELAAEGGSVADTLAHGFALMGLAARPLQRVAAGTEKITTGLDRLEEIEAVHDGAAYTGSFGSGIFAGQKTNTDIEEVALQRWKDGTWSKDEALDFLTASGAGASHDPGLELASSIALDPTVFGSLGAAALAKMGAVGLRLAVSEAGTTIRVAGTARKANVLGKLAESDKVSSAVRYMGEHVYTPMEQSHLGTAAKVMRTIVDPLHAIGGNKVIGEATVDLASEMTPRIMADAHGFSGTLEALNLARDTSPEMLGMMAEDAATYSGNIARKSLMRLHVASMLFKSLGHELIGKNPGSILEGLVRNAPSDYVKVLKEEMVRVREMMWDEVSRANLADRMEAFYGEKTAAEWGQKMSGMSDEALSYLHASTYGRATKMFLQATEKASQVLGPAAAAQANINRMVLLNRDTLTHLGAQGILDDIAQAATLAEKMEFMRVAQRAYPELAYVVIDKANMEHSLSEFVRRLGNQIDDGVLPMQLTDAEIAKLPEELQLLYEKMHGTYGFALRPEDDLMMGLIRDGEGRYVEGFAPWVDHVASTPGRYRGSVALAHNVAGMPIIGQPIAHGLDFVESAARTTMSKVTAATVMESARTRFVVKAAKQHGIAESQAKAMFEAVSEAAQLRKIAARGLSARNMWEATRHLVPTELETLGKFTQRDLLNLVLDAYEGDLRFVGLTQKFTGRAKAIFGRSGSNFAGQVSEDLYQKIRFLYNPIFQVQERIEPWVLTGQRGASAALGTKLSEADRLTARLYEQMRNSGLIRASDIDQAEWSAMAMTGTDMEQSLVRYAEQSRWGQIRDVAGAKRLNMLRTWQRNMGKSVRVAFEKNQKGSWDRIVQHYSDMAGGLISDDDAAVRYLTEQGFAGDVKVESIIKPGAKFSDFSKAISTAEFHMPANLGELKSLELDFMARGMGFPLKDGTVVTDAASLRRALADPQSGLSLDNVGEVLRMHGAHPDYVRRVENALTFHWDGFWRTATSKYSLSRVERKSLETMMTEAARVRGMTPVDYMSQVFSPTILAGKGADVNALESAVSILRAPLKGEGTSEDLMTQMVDVFRHHLDPSGQETLLRAFGHELPGDIAALEGAGQTTAAGELRATAAKLSGEAPAAAPEYARFGTDARGNATVPDVFASEPGYVYRTVNEARLASDWRVGEYAAKHPATIYADSQRSVVTRVREGDRFEEAVSGVNAADNVRAKGIITADEVEVLGADGKWHPANQPAAGAPGSAWDETASREFANKVLGRAGITSVEPRVIKGDATIHGLMDFEDLKTAAPADPDFAYHVTSQKNLESIAKGGLKPSTQRPDKVYFGENADTLWSLVPARNMDNPVILRVNRTKTNLGVDIDPTTGTQYSGELVSGAVGPEALEYLGADNAWHPLGKAPVEPDVERAIQQFSKWSKSALTDGLLTKGRNPYSDLLTKVTGIPTDNAVPFNQMHQLLVNQVGNALRQGADDAFRLQYFATERSVLQRSLNHPFFGIYPASYMWGKIAPELARFMAHSPFGVRTGAATYAASDFVKSAALQRELDPDFDKLMEDLGHSETGWFLGYMLPSLPWDIGAAAPSWARDLSRQALENQGRRDAGLDPLPISLTSRKFGQPGPFERVEDYINPLRSGEQIKRPLGELGDVIAGEPEPKSKGPYVGSPSISGEVQGTELDPILIDQMGQLTRVLSGE